MIADDHPPTLAGVRAALEGHGFQVAAEAEDAAGAALRERPDVCLLDVHMPGSGIAACADIRSQLPATQVVMLTVSQNDGDLFAALQARAAGYLLKGMIRRGCQPRCTACSRGGRAPAQTRGEARR